MHLLGSQLQELSTDAVDSVRVEFSKILAQFCRCMGKEYSTLRVVPILSQLCRDANPAVRANAIDNIQALVEYVDAAALTAFTPVLTTLVKDPKWRVRKSAVEKAGIFATVMDVEQFDLQLLGLVLASLSDHVFTIRETCCQQVGTIVKKYGDTWAINAVFPKAFAMYDTSANYLHRMTCLLVVMNVAPHCSTSTIEQHLLPILAKAVVDKVANVKIMACKVMAYLIRQVSQKVSPSRHFAPLLQTLKKDADDDVIFFSNETSKLVDTNPSTLFVVG